ncbi:MAG: CxxxxCH/CxxCH domain-containing protein [Desulfuromonadales bacterium]|nr:CxxxxCH/CxxCH domain-containing protein [Desulfuromonadales bacterium]
MKPRAMFTAVVLTALLALPQLAGAAAVHTFDCKNCHIPTLSVTDLGGGNVCLTCHSAELNTLLNDGTTGATNSAFGGLDSSNAMGNNSFVVADKGQTSHNWSGPDTQAAAGAVAPSRTTHPEFYSRQGSSTGRVTCSRCHNPHADDTNPQLLVKGAGSTETMCTACHTPWVKGAGMTNITHPVDIDYATAAAAHPGKYVAVGSLPTNDGNINTDTPISLTGGKVVCGSCHQVHFADSNPTTPDIPSNWDNLSFSGGNGKALRSYGRMTTDATGGKSSALCTTCHIYEKHGGTHATLGCLDCHGGHSPAGNFNMLRPVVNALGWVPKDLAPGDSDPLAYTTTTAEWKNATGTGYCQGCHTIPLTVSQHNVASAGAAQCVGCHSHSTGSFTKTCNGCHGYAPTTNTAGGTTGYAVTTTAPIYNYLTASGGTVFKDESQTPHKRHTNGGTDYSIACNECHYTVVDVDTAPHKDGNFQQVTFNGGSGGLARTDGATPAYTVTGTGSCASVYCHSNGGPRGGTIKYSATAPLWATGAGDITACNVCHGNDAASMAAAQRNNSATHAAHLSKGYSCAACHSQTATGNTALVTAGGDHVDGQADVFYKNNYSLGAANLGTGSYNNTDGTCGIYCHSNGTTQVTPDWDTASTGACGTCHKYNANADATQDGTGPALGGAHNVHVFNADGPKLACTICHTNNGTGADHVNGAKSYVANMQTSVCNPCHGSTAGVTTGNDREPIWASATSVDCATCHVGVVATINARTAPAKNSFYVSGGGHGDPTLPAGSPDCAGCHALTADHLDGVTDSNMLTGGATANDAYCKSCHAINSHYANTKTAGGTSNDGLACATCHEPHGDGMGTNTDVMLLGTIATRTVNNFTDKTARASYWEADNTGVCQICHDPAEVNYFNRTASGVTADTSHNPGSACTQCHRHESTPEAFAAGCTDCHGNTATGNYWPDSTAQHGTAWPNRLGSHDIHITRIAGAGATIAQKNATCGYCHPSGGHSGEQAAAPADLMNGTTSKFKNILGAANVQTSAVTQAAGNVSCSNVDCHYKTATVATDWYTSGSQANCSYCHTVADSPYVAGTLPDAHDKHMGEFASVGRNLVCTDCHVSAGANNAHQDGVIGFTTALAPLETTVTMSSAVTAGTVAGPKYGLSAVTTQFSSCATLYCHSNGQTTWTSVTANWASTTVDCTSCHKGAAAGSTLTGAHLAHTFSGATTIGRNLGCQECHSTTVNNNTTISDASKHVQKVRDLLVPNFGTPQAGCATVYCHSNGNTGNLGYNNPAWAASYGCDSCHGDGAGKSYPTYVNGGVGANANSHTEHIVGGGYTCNECHAAVSTAGTAINGTTPTKHIDQTVDVNGTKISSYLTGTCNTVSCHGGNSPVWGTSLGCRDCHANATNDTDDFTYNNSTFAKVALDEWTFSGHGKAAASNYEVTGRAGADLDAKGGAGQDACLYCHDGSVSHGNANLFRLRSNSGLGYTDLNGACLGCHDTGTTSYDPDGAGGLNAVNVTTVVKIDKYHGGAGHNATDRDAGRWCWDCHDPHGDADAAGQRIQMVQRNPQVNPDANGVPASLATTNDIIFTNNTTGAAAGSFAMTAAPFSQGICNACHTAANTDQYTQTTGAGSHPTSKCTTCHKHSGDAAYDGNAFKGSGCNGCHGNSVAGNYWPDDFAGAAMPTANVAGRHAKHIEVLAAQVYGQTLAQLLADVATDTKQRNLCAFCHNTPGTDGDHGSLASLPADVNSMKDLWAPYAADGASYSSDQHGQAGNDTCSSVNCHNNMTTADNTYGWYNAGTSACIMCHINAPAEQTHSSHLSGTVYGLTADNCAYCHDAATNWATNTKPAASHINGTFNVGGSVTLTYGGTYPTVKGSCGANACHNDGRNQAPATTPYTWGTTTNSGCNFCHPGNSAGHSQHNAGYNVFYSNAGLMWCTSCHTHSGPSAAHMNANINVLGTMGYNGTNLGVTQAASPGTCTTTTCHQDGRGTAKPTPVWNRTPSSVDDCSLCHFNVAPAATFSHDTHIGAAAAIKYNTAVLNNSTAGEYRFNCAKCHGNNLAKHLDSTIWTAANVAVNVDASVSYNAGADTCLNNACHNNGKGAGVGNDTLLTANWTTGWVSDADSDKCNNCHGNSPSTNAHRAHAVGIHAEDIYSGTTGKLTTATATKSHGDATNSSTISCNVCHSGTVTSARNKFGTECNSCHSGAAEVIMTVADKSKHVDDGTAIAEVSFADMTAFKSKAQLRDNLADATENGSLLSAIWNRVTGYKAATDYDKGQAAFATPTFAAGNCSNVACHNNNLAIWNSAGNINPATYAPNCMGCHTSLPK